MLGNQLVRIPKNHRIFGIKFDIPSATDSYQSLPSALNEKPFDCRSCKIEQSGGSLSSLLPKSLARSANKSLQIVIAFLVEPSRPPCPALLHLHRHVDACVGQIVAGCHDASKVNRS